MHAARGVLTVRGGMTSHAAVIARGIGLPCVVGAADLRLDPVERSLTSRDGRIFREGALITARRHQRPGQRRRAGDDPAELGGAFSDLLDWADAVRDLGVRANADTPAEARTAREFRVDGLGLCRTEHMFFDEARIMVMREMILADTDAERQAALDKLLPMQRADFIEIFEIMRGLPVTIRLLDPPLHEFLPKEEATSAPSPRRWACPWPPSPPAPATSPRSTRCSACAACGSASSCRRSTRCRRARSSRRHRRQPRRAAAPVVPEMMIPLVSAYREVELVKARIDAIAAAVLAERGDAATTGSG